MRVLKGHGHWVNTLALSTEHVLRTGAFDQHGKAPEAHVAARQAAAARYAESCHPGPHTLVDDHATWAQIQHLMAAEHMLSH